MESVALKYFSIDVEKVLSLKTANRDNPDAFKRELLRIWANKNPGINQVKVSYNAIKIVFSVSSIAYH